MGSNSTDKEKLQRILERNAEISPQKMQAYLDGKLSPEAHHEVERQLLSSDFATEALEGYEQATKRIDISKVSKSLQRDIKQYNKERGYGTDYRVWYAAASIVLLFVITVGIWKVGKEKASESLSMKTSTEEVIPSAAHVADGGQMVKDSLEFLSEADVIQENLAFNQEKEKSGELENKRPELKEEQKVAAKAKEQDFATSDVWIEKVESVAANSATLSDDKPVSIEQEDEDSEFTHADVARSESRSKKDYNNTLYEAMRAFEEKNYTSASLLFDTHLRTKPNDAQALFYAGMSAYLNSDYKKAIPFFEKFLNLKNTLDYRKNHVEAEWNLANAYQKVGNNTKAKQLFTQIANSESKYASQAKQKLK